MDSQGDDLQVVLLPGLRGLSAEELLRYTRSVSPPPGAPPIPHSSPHIGSTEIDLSEQGDETEDSGDETEDGESGGTPSPEHSVLLLGLQGLSLDELKRYTRPVSPPVGSIPVPIYPPIPHGIQEVCLEEATGIAPTGQFSIATTEPHRIINVYNFPNELILNILGHLHWRDIVRSRRVCRWIQEEVDRSVKHQFRIALGLSSLEDNPNAGPLVIADRLRLLHAKQQAWRNLERCKAVTFSVSPLSFSYFFIQGVLGCYADPNQHLRYVMLPTAEEVETGVKIEWSEIKFGFSVADFAVDVEQDLLIVIGRPAHDSGQPFLIHFWTFSTHVPHPAARLPTLEHHVKYSTADIQVVGSHVGITSAASRGFDWYLKGRLDIYSWTTGQILAYVDAPGGRRFPSYTFISPYTFVTHQSDSNSLVLYSFDPHSTVDPAPESKPLVSFMLPDEWPSRTTFDLPSCQAYPPPRTKHIHLTSDSVEIPPFLPFSMDSEDGIIAFWLEPRHDSGLMFVVHRSSLMSYLNGWDNSQGVRIVEWHAWGPKNTRWFDDMCGQFFYARTTYGHRLVVMKPSVDDPTRKFIAIRDFNPALISKELTRSVPSDLVTAPTLASKGNFTVESELPYLETRSKSVDCTAVLLDDHRILLLQRHDQKWEDATMLLI